MPSFSSFNVVLVGENFPVSQINASDFEFNFRTLKETMRLPVALQAEARGVSLQILPDRFEATVLEPSNPTEAAVKLVAMVETFFEYVGPRAVRAVGHNAQVAVLGTERNKTRAMRTLVDTEAASGMLGVPILGVDTNLYFQIGQETKSRVAIVSETLESILLDFNANYDANSGIKARDAVSRLGSSVDAFADIADRISASLLQGVDK